MRVFRLPFILPWIVLCAALAALSPAGHAAEAAEIAQKKTPWYADWFEPALDSKVLARYAVETVDAGWSEGRAYRNLPPKGRKLRGKHVVAVLPKKSSSYPKAFNRLLGYMARKFPGSRVTLFNFQKKEAYGLKVLAYAQEHEADLIFTIGSEAAVLAGTRFVGSGIPVVTCNNKDPVLLGLLENTEGGSGTNIAYTTVNMPVEELFLWTTKFRSDLKTITLVYNVQHQQVRKTEVGPLRKMFSEKGVRVIDAATRGKKTVMEDLDDLIPAAVREMRAADADFSKSLIVVTSCTSIWEQPALGHLVKLAGRCPVLGTIPAAVDGSAEGALVAIGLARANAAHLACVYAGRILGGQAKPGELPLGWVTPPDIAVSFRKAREIGVPIPFEILENATFIYGYDGRLVMSAAQE